MLEFTQELKAYEVLNHQKLSLACTMTFDNPIYKNYEETLNRTLVLCDIQDLEMAEGRSGANKSQKPANDRVLDSRTVT